MSGCCDIWPVPIFSDNYVWILEREGSNRVAVVDPGDGVPVIEELSRRDLEIAAVLITHHHQDHVGGLPELIRCFHPPVYGSATESVAGVDHPVTGGDRVSLPDLDLEFEIVGPPGSHIRPHRLCRRRLRLCRRHPLRRRLRAGLRGHHGTDARLADPTGGTRRPRPWPTARTSTPSRNLRFAARGGTGQQALARPARRPSRPREPPTEPTVPSTIGYELETNPFLRCGVASVHAAAESHAGHALRALPEVFGVLRTLEGRVVGLMATPRTSLRLVLFQVREDVVPLEAGAELLHRALSRLPQPVQIHQHRRHAQT